MLPWRILACNLLPFPRNYRWNQINSTKHIIFALFYLHVWFLSISSDFWCCEYTNGAQNSKYLLYPSNTRTTTNAGKGNNFMFWIVCHFDKLLLDWMRQPKSQLPFLFVLFYKIWYAMICLASPRFLYIFWTLLTTSGIQQHYSIDLLSILAIEWHLSPSFHWVCGMSKNICLVS